MTEKRTIIGLRESVIIYSQDMKRLIGLIARVDTGAASSSLDIGSAKPLGLAHTGKRVLVTSANGKSKRNVVYLKTKIAGKLVTGRFTLADRSKMRYKALIGREVLSNAGFLIDPKNKISGSLKR